MTDLLYYPLGELQEAVFVRRENRFRAEVELNGQIVKAHVPNSGRMQELLVSGAKVWVKPVKEDGTHKKNRTKNILHLGAGTARGTLYLSACTSGK